MARTCMYVFNAGAISFDVDTLRQGQSSFKSNVACLTPPRWLESWLLVHHALRRKHSRRSAPLVSCFFFFFLRKMSFEKKLEEEGTLLRVDFVVRVDERKLQSIPADCALCVLSRSCGRASIGDLDTMENDAFGGKRKPKVD